MKAKDAKGNVVDAEALVDLAVDRIDGVDRPATGRKFVLFKSAAAAERAVRKGSGGLFGDIVFGVKKAVREYLPGQDGVKPTNTSSVAAAMESWNGKPTDATREPAHPATSGFTKPGPSHGLVRALDTYQFADPWLRGELHADPGFSEGEGSDIPEAANFKPTQPGDLPNDGGGMQFSKNALLWAYEDAKKSGDSELAQVIAKRLAKAGVDVRKSVDSVQWVHGPARWSRKR